MDGNGSDFFLEERERVVLSETFLRVPDSLIIRPRLRMDTRASVQKTKCPVRMQGKTGSEGAKGIGDPCDQN